MPQASGKGITRPAFAYLGHVNVMSAGNNHFGNGSSDRNRGTPRWLLAGGQEITRANTLGEVTTVGFIIHLRQHSAGQPLLSGRAPTAAAAFTLMREWREAHPGAWVEVVAPQGWQPSGSAA